MLLGLSWVPDDHSATLSHRVRTRGVRRKGYLLLTSEVLLENLIFPSDPPAFFHFFLYWLELVICQLFAGHWERRHRISQPIMTNILSLGAGPTFTEIKGSLPTASIKWGSGYSLGCAMVPAASLHKAQSSTILCLVPYCPLTFSFFLSVYLGRMYLECCLLPASIWDIYPSDLTSNTTFSGSSPLPELCGLSGLYFFFFRTLHFLIPCNKT